MKKAWIILPLTFLFLSSACDPVEEGRIDRCEDLQEELDLELGISFGMAYCQGDFCIAYEDENGNQNTVDSKEECEAIDVVVRGNIEEWGQDGIGDCKWIEEPVSSCVPNRWEEWRD